MRKSRVYAILILMLTLIFVLTLAACSKPDFTEPDDTDDENKLTRTQIITNGTFYNVSNSTGSNSYIKEVVSNWTSTAGTLSKNDAGVRVGAIDLSDKNKFENERALFSKNSTINYPGVDPKTPKEKDEPDKLQDTNALLISSVDTEGSVYYKNDTNFSLAKGTWYRLQFSVYTDVIDEGNTGNKGAWVIIDGGVYAEFPRINTKGHWVTYELYIEANDYEAREIKVRLWLGHGPAKVNLTSSTAETNPYLTQGTVLFDNIICTEIEKNEYDTAKTGVSETKKISSMIFPDLALLQQNEQSISTSTPNYFYSFRSGTNGSNNSANYQLIAGKSDLTANKPTVKENYTGIVDMSKMYYYDPALTGEAKFKNSYKEFFSSSTAFTTPNRADFINDNGVYGLYASTKLVNGTTGSSRGVVSDSKALMIYHPELSGAGFKSNKTLLIEKNKYYSIRVWVYVWSIAIPTPTSTDLGGVTQPSEPTTARPDMSVKEADLISAAAAYLVKLGAGETYDSFIADVKTAYGEDMKTKVEEAVANWAGAAPVEEVSVLLSNYINDAKRAYDDAAAVEKLWTEYETKNTAYTTALNEWMVKYVQWQGVNSEVTGTAPDTTTVFKPKAHIKVTGAGDVPAVYTDQVGVWQQLEINIKGNQLSNRKVNFEMWFGEGSTADYDKLMFGGALFDNIEISVLDAEDPAKNYSELTPFSDTDLYDIGSLTSTAAGTVITLDDENNGTDWKLTSNEGIAESDKSNIKAEIVSGGTDYPITITENLMPSTYYYNFLKYSHENPVASSLELLPKDFLKINPNTCYRISLWARTEGIAKGLGATIALMSKEDNGKDDDYSSVSSFTGYNSEDFQELVFYVKGDSLLSNLFTIKITLGSGTMFNTASYVEGSVYITAITMKEIKYSEYNATTKSGDQTKSYAFANTTYSDSISNGNFGSIDLTNVKEEDINANGDLIGVVASNLWTKGSVASNSYNKPALSTKADGDEYYLYWEGVVDADNESPEGYEVYVSNITQKDSKGKDKTVDNFYIGYINANAPYETTGSGDAEVKKYRFKVPSYAKGNFTVKPVSVKGVGVVSNSVANIATKDDTMAEPRAAEFTEFKGVAKKESLSGTINYKTYNNGQYSNIYDGSDYVSAYSTLLMLSSNYEIRMGMESSTRSISANKYYEIRVWLKTINGAQASITFKDISSVLETNDQRVGYFDQDTNGKWVQYRFVVATGDLSDSISLVLSLGNPYAKGVPVTVTGSSSTTTMYRSDVTSMGTAFFDSIRVDEITEDEYKVYTEGSFTPAGGGDKVSAEEIEYSVANPKFAEYEMVYTNAFAFKLLTFRTDSFDSYTENTKTNEDTGFALGHTPNAYTWSKAAGAIDTDDARLYGVYSYRDLGTSGGASDKLITNDEYQNPFDSFKPSNFDLARFLLGSGDNVLLMSNLTANGQLYTLKNSKTISAKTYYAVTFKAKTLVPSGKYGEFRFYGDVSDNASDYKSMRIEGDSSDVYALREFTYYVYNDNDVTSKSIKWAFALGGDSADTKVTGMLLIDDVSVKTITKDEFEAAETAYNALSDNEKVSSGKSFLVYENKDDDSTGGDEDPIEPTPKPSIFDRGDIWLLVSTIVIGVAIIITVIVVLVKKVRKKRKKVVKGENTVKTDKVPIEVIAATNSATLKDEADNDEEFIDKKEIEKPKYVQRTVAKKKKK